MYNGSNYLHEAIDSALAQTYQNCEVIVVNDGSNDAGQTEAIALSYGNKIRYFSKENGGVASALNYGIRQMTGEWFAWLSHDDLFPPDRIEEDIELIKSNPNVRITFCNIYTINEKRVILCKTHYSLEEISNSRQLLEYEGVNMCSMTIHKTCFEKVGLFDGKFITTQDVLMTLRLSMYYSFFLNNKSTTYIRDHPHRDTYRLSEQHKSDILKVCDFMHDEMRVEHFLPDLKINDAYDSEGYFWMGWVYNGFGANDFADEYFSKSLTCQKNFVKKLWMRARLLRFNLRKIRIKKC